MTPTGSAPEHPADQTQFPRAIGRPASRALIEVGLTDYAALAARQRADVAALHGVGPKALGVLDAELAARGMGWADAQ